MNKRIISFLLSLVLVIAMMATAVPAFAADDPVELTVTADKETANPGDTVKYSVSIGAVENFGVLEFLLKIPAGMTIVDSSIAIPEGVAEAMDSDGDIVVPAQKNSYKWSYSAMDEGYTGTTPLVILTFDCTVNDDSALETKEVTIEVSDCYDNEIEELPYTVKSGTVKVEAKPIPVTGITADETMSLGLGESKTITWSVLPAEATNKDVTFSITGDAATVDATGKVTSVKEGIATVTIKTVDGEYTATCEVTVACTHEDKTSTAAAASDCKAQGWDAYSTCDECGQIFNDAGEEIDEIPYLPLADHQEKTPATCTSKAVCDVCNEEYGNVLPHSFTKEEVKDAALKTAGDCKQKAVYVKSCASCGLVDTDETNTFEGELNAANHASYGTYIDGAAEPDHKNGKDGYTGDEKCRGCDAILEEGETIPAGTHVPADVWSKDENEHWKECTVTGCGVVIDGTKAVHSSELAANKATCTSKAICDVCKVPYGNTLAHDFTKEEVKDAALKTAGDCNKKAVYVKSCASCGLVDTDETNTFEGEFNKANHADYGTYVDGATEPDHKNGVDGYTGDKKCNGCDAVLEEGEPIPAGEHVPSEDWESDESEHWKECSVDGCGVVIKASVAEHSTEKPENMATCQKQAVCDVCGESYGRLANHQFDYEDWKSDSEQHWNECLTPNCGEKANVSDHSCEAGEATCEQKLVCDDCGEEFGELGDHEYGEEVPEVPAEIGKDGLKAHYQCSVCEKYFVDVEHDTHVEKKEVAYEDLIIPALVDEEITIELPYSVIVEKTGDLDPSKETFNFKVFDFGFEDAEFEVEGLSVETNGVKTYNGKLVIKVKESQFGNLSEGFKFAQIKGNAEGWTYDETVYYLVPQISDTGVSSFVIFPGDEAWGNTILEEVEFTNSYKAEKVEEPTDSEDTDKPETGDNSMIVLWIVLMFVGGFGVVAFTVITKKRSVK